MIYFPRVLCSLADCSRRQKREKETQIKTYFLCTARIRSKWEHFPENFLNKATQAADLSMAKGNDSYQPSLVNDKRRFEHDLFGISSCLRSSVMLPKPCIFTV